MDIAIFKAIIDEIFRVQGSIEEYTDNHKRHDIL